MADICDMAQEYDELFRISALSKIKPLGRATPQIIDCVDCGERIDKKRKKALPFAIRCIDCQEKYEKKK